MSTQTIENLNSKQTFAGTWHNQHNSEIVLMVAPDGKVNGSFRIAHSKHKDAVFPLAGFVCGDVIGFCVNFDPHASVTSWTGHIIHHTDGKGLALDTLWHMGVHMSNTTDEQLWKSVFSGADVFHPGPRTGSMSWHKTAASHPYPLWVPNEGNS